MKIEIKINVNLDYQGMSPKLVREWKRTIAKLRKNPNVSVEGGL